jgi:hypothetical protein
VTSVASPLNFALAWQKEKRANGEGAKGEVVKEKGQKERGQRRRYVPNFETANNC